MTNPIPEERFILKQDLWKRIDKSVDLINTSADEVGTRMANLKEETIAYYNRLIETLRISKEELKVTAENELVKVKKDLEKFIQGEVDRLILNQKEFLVKIDSRLGLFQSQIDEKVKWEMDSRLGKLESDIKDIDKRTVSADKSVRKSIIDSQNEIMEKFNEMRLKFERVIANMKSLSSIIGK